MHVSRAKRACHPYRSMAVAVALGVLSTGAYATQANVDTTWDVWAVSNEESTQVINHKPMTNILRSISVEERGKESVAYVALTGRSLEYVDAYISFLERIPISRLNRNEQLAYWLNLHNVGIIRMLAENKNGHRKLKKYRGVPGMPGNEWSEKMFTVEGRALSLEDIEQNILFRHWKDPLIIYGLCYGAKGSPSIGKVGFSGATVKAQLEENARNFINSNQNVRVRKANLRVSSLYTWNQDTLFDGDDEAVVAHLSAYAKPALAEKLAGVRGINRNKFNWSSNAYIPRAASQAGFGGFGGGGGGGGGSFGAGS